jgi:hypothetical protein
MTMSEADGSGRDVDLRAAPDWAAIRRAYCETEETQRGIAQRFGVMIGQLARRAARERWTRPGAAAMDPPDVDALDGMVRDIRRAAQSMVRRGNRLMARSEQEDGKVEDLLALHERNVGCFAKLMRMVERLAKMFDRMKSDAPPKEEHPQDVRARFEDRLAAIAARMRAEGFPVPPDE